jgi:hypothetical protein
MENKICLPGLTEDETRYFQYLLTRTLKEITEQQWKDLGVLNQKTLKNMYEEAKRNEK